MKLIKHTHVAVWQRDRLVGWALVGYLYNPYGMTRQDIIETVEMIVGRKLPEKGLKVTKF